MEHDPLMTAAVLDPIAVLDRYLEGVLAEAQREPIENEAQRLGHNSFNAQRSLERDGTIASTSRFTAVVAATAVLASKQDEILRVGRFLFGNNIMEGALSLLDECILHTESSSFANDPNKRIVQIVSPGSHQHHHHHRSLYLIKKSCTSASSSSSAISINRRGSHHRQHEDACSHYLCILSSLLASNNPYVMYFCSCRSFMDRNKTGVMALCKHLLALRLMPYLTIPAIPPQQQHPHQPPQYGPSLPAITTASTGHATRRVADVIALIQAVSDESFSQLIVDRILDIT